MFSPETIRLLVEEKMPGAKAVVRDTTGTNDHFELVVVAEAFRGKNPVERHRMVYGLLGDMMTGPIHALSIRAKTPDEK